MERVDNSSVAASVKLSDQDRQLLSKMIGSNSTFSDDIKKYFAMLQGISGGDLARLGPEFKKVGLTAEKLVEALKNSSSMNRQDIEQIIALW